MLQDFRNDNHRRKELSNDGSGRRALTDLVRNDQETSGRNSLNEMAKEFLLKNPEVKYLGKPEWGGSDVRDEKQGVHCRAMLIQPS